MDISTIVMISCVLTGVTMTVMAIIAAFLLRFGSQGLVMLFNRLMGGLNQDRGREEPEVASQSASRAAVTSGDSLRRRARDMDFPAAQAAPQMAPPQYGAQAAPQTAFQAPMQPALRARDTLQYSGSAPVQQFGTQPIQPNNASLSPSRPYQGGAMPARPAQAFPQQSGFTQPAPQQGFPQQGGFTQPAPQQGFPQQGGFTQPAPLQGNLPRPAAPQGFPQQGGFPQPAPLQGNLPRPAAPQGFPQQGGFPQPAPLQGNLPRPAAPQGFPQQGGFPQPAPQQGGITEYRPGLRRSGTSDASDGSLRASSRDSRRNDDQEIYDDDPGGFLSNLPL